MITPFPDLLPRFRQAAAQHQDLLPIFQAVLPDIVAALPGSQAALLYRHVPEGLVLRVATQADAPLDKWYPLAALPYHTEALHTRQPVINSAQQTLVAPLIFHDNAEAVLEVQFDVRAADSLDWLAALVEQLSLALENQSLRDLLYRLSSATTQLSTCTTYPQIAAVLGKTLTRQGQFVTINVFERDDNHTVIGMRVLASANRDEAFDNQSAYPFTPAIQAIHAALAQRGEGLSVLDITTEPVLDAVAQAWLKELAVKSLFLLPMHSGGQITGYIAMNDTRRALIYTRLEQQMLRTLAEQVAVVVQNQHYVEEIQAREEASLQQVQLLQLLNDLSTVANIEQDEQKLLDKAAQGLLAATHLSQCGIALLDRDGKYATVRSVYPPTTIAGFKIEVGVDSVAAILRATQEPLVITDIAHDARLTPQTRQLLLDAGAYSSLFFPLYDTQQQLIGTVGLDAHHAVTTFEPEMIRRAETIVTQVGINLQKIRLIEDSRRQAAQMQRITAFSQAVQASLEVPGIIQTTLEHAARMIVPLDYLAILIFNPLTGLLEQTALWQDQQARVLQPGQPLNRDDNLLAWTAWDNQTFIAIDDVQTSPRHIHPQENTLRTIVVAPVLAAGNSYGLLEAGASVPFAYSAADVAAVQQISNQVGVALKNAAAFAYSQEEAEQKALAGRITTLLQQQVDLNSILTVTAQELGKALGAKRARIRMGVQPQETGKSS